MGDARKALTQIDKGLEARWRFERDKAEANHEIELAQATKKKTVKKPAKLPLPQLLYDDITLEKLTISMAETPHGSLVFYDELASWLSSFTRYSADGDSSGARAFWNKAYPPAGTKETGLKMKGRRSSSSAPPARLSEPSSLNGYVSSGARPTTACWRGLPRYGRASPRRRRLLRGNPRNAEPYCDA